MVGESERLEGELEMFGCLSYLLEDDEDGLCMVWS